MSGENILIVEDDGILAMHLEDVLRGLAYHVGPAVPTGRAALAAVRDRRPDLILLDIELAGELNGIAVAEEIHATDDVPVVFLTGFSNDPLVQRAKAAAPYGYLVKPVPERELAATIEMALYHHALDRRLRASEAALRASEARYRRLVETLQEGVWEIDTEGVTTYVNPRMAAMLGYTVEEMLGAPLFSFMTAEAVAVAREKLEQRRRGVKEQHDFEFRRKDGTTMLALLETGPVYDEAGRHVGAIAGISDITARRAAEESRLALERQLHQAMRMDAIGRLAGGVAHDFNNLLTVISGNVAALAERREMVGECGEQLAEVRKAADSAAMLTRQLLAFSRRQVVEPKVVDVNAAIRGLERMLRRLIGEDVELRAELAPGALPVLIDPGHLEQVLVNLAVNAREAMPHGGALRLESSSLALGDGEGEDRPGVRPGPYVRLRVSDTGRGIPDEVRRHVFEPFFTTKDLGTGMGLATVYGIVTQAGGAIEVASQPGEGTQFTILLPRVEARPVRPSTARIAPRRGRGEVVLVVEDEPMVRRMARRALERAGYAVLEASDGLQALDLVREREGAIDLVLSDVVMPRMNGRELSELIRQLRPGLKVVFTSGYTDDIIARHGVLTDGTAFLTKPYTPQTLVEKVAEALKTSSPPDTA